MSVAANRPELERSQTYPPTVKRDAESESGTMSAQTKPAYNSFEDELESNPDLHFLSPIQPYEYFDWADDSDDDDGEEVVEWDAGITDFALFDNDKRQAEQHGERLPDKWQGVVASQASALERSIHRRQTESDLPDLARTASAESMPGLTPDSSPNLRDDLDVETFEDHSAQPSKGQTYLTVVITPDDAEENAFEEDEGLPLSFYVDSGKQQRIASGKRKLQRPGLRHSRTLSGKAHVWRRPSWHIYPVGEDVEAEEAAEISDPRVRKDR